MERKKFWPVLTVLGLALAAGAGCNKTTTPTDSGASAMAKPQAASALTPGCPFTLGFWKNHNNEANNPSQQIPWPVCGQDPQGEGTLLCGMTWLSILQTTDRGDAWLILAHQWIPAELNVCNGVSPTADIQNDLDEAQSILAANCATLDPTSDTGQQAVSLASQLDAFNNGQVVPCGAVVPTPTPAATDTPTPSPST